LSYERLDDETAPAAADEHDVPNPSSSPLERATRAAFRRRVHLERFVFALHSASELLLAVLLLGHRLMLAGGIALGLIGVQLLCTYALVARHVFGAGRARAWVGSGSAGAGLILSLSRLGPVGVLLLDLRLLSRAAWDAAQPLVEWAELDAFLVAYGTARLGVAAGVQALGMSVLEMLLLCRPAILTHGRAAGARAAAGQGEGLGVPVRFVAVSLAASASALVVNLAPLLLAPCARLCCGGHARFSPPWAFGSGLPTAEVEADIHQAITLPGLRASSDGLEALCAAIRRSSRLQLVRLVDTERVDTERVDTDHGAAVDTEHADTDHGSVEVLECGGTWPKHLRPNDVRTRLLASLAHSRSQADRISVRAARFDAHSARLIADALLANDRIHRLELIGCALDGRGAHVLASALPSCAVRSLKLSANRCGDKGAVALARALRSCPQLRLLALDGNEVRDAGARELGLALQASAPAAAEARGERGEEAGCRLEALWLDSNRIGDVGCRALAAGVRASGSVHSLNLLLNACSVEAATALVNACASKGEQLRHLCGEAVHNTSAASHALRPLSSADCALDSYDLMV
jgi:Ran GTPase-activating protein (RanGAP) involved in mRNA processing and transport